MPIDRRPSTAFHRTAQNTVAKTSPTQKLEKIVLDENHADQIFSRVAKDGIDRADVNGLIRMTKGKEESLWITPGRTFAEGRKEGFAAGRSQHVPVVRSDAFNTRLTHLLEKNVDEDLLKDVKEEIPGQNRRAGREFACPPSADELRATWRRHNPGSLDCAPSADALLSAWRRGD